MMDSKVSECHHCHCQRIYIASPQIVFIIELFQGHSVTMGTTFALRYKIRGVSSNFKYITKIQDVHAL